MFVAVLRESEAGCGATISRWQMRSVPLLRTLHFNSISTCLGVPEKEKTPGITPQGGLKSRSLWATTHWRQIHARCQMPTLMQIQWERLDHRTKLSLCSALSNSRCLFKTSFKRCTRNFTRMHVGRTSLVSRKNKSDQKIKESFKRNLILA